MPIGDFDLLSNALELHMFCTGSSDCIGYKQAHHIFENLMRRLKEWKPSLMPSNIAFDDSVHILCKVVCREYTAFRDDFCERHNRKPEEQECWQDGHFITDEDEVLTEAEMLMDGSGGIPGDR